MRLVPVESVREGSFLAKTIFDDNGRILLREGIKLSTVIINRIKAIKIYSIYIIDEYSSKEIEDVITPELRQKAIKVVKDTFFGLEKSTLSASRSGTDKNKLNSMIKERENYFAAISQVANELMDELLTKKNVLVNLVDIKSMDSYTYQHSVNVAVLSLILGLELRLNKYELYDLCIGALVHDIGKILVPKELILKEGPLTEAEFKLVKEHALKGYDYLRSVQELSSPARVISLQHHERYDGKGYPENRSGSNISKLARIVSVADVYDALTSDRPYRRAMSPNEAIEYIMGSGSGQFDYDMVRVFSKVVVPYPEGTLVKLSTGEYAVIEEVYPNYPLRPKVKIIKSKILERVNCEVSLLSALDVVILGAEYEIKEA